MPAFAWKKPAAAPEPLKPPEPVVEAAPPVAAVSATSASDPPIEGLDQAGVEFYKAPTETSSGKFGWNPSGFQRPRGKAPPPHLVVGDRVRLTGLEGPALELNGVEGVVVEFDLEQRKWRVVIDGKHQMVDQGIDAKNLEKWAPLLKDAAPAPQDVKAEQKEVPGVKNSWAPSAKNSQVSAPVVEQTLPSPSIPEAAAPELNDVPAALRGVALKSILKNARPDWKDKELVPVVEKLGKVRIDSGLELLVALKDREGKALNERLKVVGEKAFAVETLRAMASSESLLNEATKKVGAKDAQPAKTTPPQAMLPTFNYQVAVREIRVYKDRSTTSESTGVKKQGDSIVGVLESFDGWVRLPGELGWIPKQSMGQETLAPTGKPRLAVLNATATAGFQNFVVVFKHVALRAAPAKGALILEMKTAGTEVLADYQSYDGWVHISGYDGWMLTSDPQLGELMRCISTGSADDDFSAEGAAG